MLTKDKLSSIMLVYDLSVSGSDPIYTRRIRMKNKDKGKRERENVRKGTDGLSPEIQYPEEVKLLEELNKNSEEKYRKWLRKKAYTEDILGKSTLLVGVRGKDGIVLGGDTKVIRGGETDCETKVKQLPIGTAPVIFASAGAIGVIEDFVEIFEKTLNHNFAERKINSLLSIKIIAEDLVEKADQRYGPRLQEPSIHFILGGLSNLTNGKAVLYEIGFPGFGQKIKYSTFVGHGSPYARTVGKYLFPRDNKTGTVSLKCNEIVDRIAFNIHWVGEDIDNYVGKDCQIVYILDDKPEVNNASFNKSKISKAAKDLTKSLENIRFGSE
jgi:20S proteasome alpha/beta subunit